MWHACFVTEIMLLVPVAQCTKIGGLPKEDQLEAQCKAINILQTLSPPSDQLKEVVIVCQTL